MHFHPSLCPPFPPRCPPSPRHKHPSYTFSHLSAPPPFPTPLPMQVMTEGDAFMVAFHDAFDAVAWCIATQLALHSKLTHARMPGPHTTPHLLQTATGPQSCASTTSLPHISPPPHLLQSATGPRSRTSTTSLPHISPRPHTFCRLQLAHGVVQAPQGLPRDVHQERRQHRGSHTLPVLQRSRPGPGPGFSGGGKQQG